MERRLLSPRFARASASEIQARLEDWQLVRVKAFERSLEDSQFALTDERCPCRADADITVAEVDRYGLPLSTVLCKQCGTLRINPYLDAASLDRFYRETYLAMYGWAAVLEDYFARQMTYGRRILALYERELPVSAAILEVGCGAGGALAVFQEHGCQVAGCDLGHELIEFGRQSGIRDLWHGTGDDVPATLADRRFHLIYMHHVFEHMSAPCGTLRLLGRLLTPDGRIVVIVPDITRVDRFPNPAGDILHFLHVAHKFNFTTSCLEAVADQEGLTSSVKNPPAHLPTAWSQMPELWVEFRHAIAPSPSRARRKPYGCHVLNKLLKIERRFLAGDFAGQFSPEQSRASALHLSRQNALKRFWRRFRKVDAA